jgi:hypothetical protein
VDGLHVRLPERLPTDHALSLRITTQPPARPKRTADAVDSHTPDIDAAG